ncbi:hypothetical protein FG379_000885 [Cryptosporidium bovis]|uniref:uncharacterized protein n=1 Tax=Cryptosporidium bovis TaxID=310047 RepID=UPI00351A5F85|nr:hypothetical protein FG379_000885 [Cryptosporidium bovis]
MERNVPVMSKKVCILSEKDFNDQIKKFKSTNDSKSSISPNDIPNGKEIFKKYDDDKHDNKSDLKVLNKKSSNKNSENKIQESERNENSKESKDKKKQGRISDNNGKEESETVVSRNKKAEKSGDKNGSEKSDAKNKNKSDKTNKRMEKELEEIKVFNKNDTEKLADHKSKTNSKNNQSNTRSNLKSDCKMKKDPENNTKSNSKVNNKEKLRKNKDSSELVLLEDGNIKLKIPYRDTEFIPKELFDTRHLFYLESNKLNKYNSYVHETSELFSIDTAFEYINIGKNSNIQ